jgi:uncharacterized protein YecE (DUF72 family)
VAQQFDLLPTEPQRPEWVERMREGVKRWADQGVYLGGSSWKYRGWLGQIFSAKRYETRGKLSQAKFDKTCLAEYAEIFPFVGGDFSFYSFYGDKFWAQLFSQVPPTFTFGLKVPERVTAPSFPNHARYGAVAGQINPDFLNADLFASQFVERLVPYGKNVAYAVFEFPRFHKFDDQSRSQFLERLDGFLGKLPSTIRYGVEIRSKKLLGEDYFAILKRHNIAHCFNSWTRMPSVGEQLNLTDPFTADFAVSRLLLRPGRTYEQAVKAFQPYDGVKDPFPEGYADAARLVREAKRKSPRRAVYLAVNNRFDGSAPHAISEIVSRLDPAT